MTIIRCADCVDYLRGVGCLSVREGARLAHVNHETLPACFAFRSPLDPSVRACATCTHCRLDGSKWRCFAPEDQRPRCSDACCVVWEGRKPENSRREHHV